MAKGDSAATANSVCLADYMEAMARQAKVKFPDGYGYQFDGKLNAGFYLEEKTGCLVHDKPVVLPSGQPGLQGYMILYAYCSKEGMEALLEGNLPPMLPATTKAPTDFASLAAIASNFGAAKPEENAEKSKYCFAFRVPAELTAQADAPGRDIWIIRLDQDVITPFIQAAIDGDAAKLSEGLKGGISSGTVDQIGTSVLMQAAFRGSPDACKVLLDKNADVNYSEPVGKKTALFFAAQGAAHPENPEKSRYLDAAKVLLDGKADPAKVNIEGSTALMFAALAGNADMVRLLLPSSNKDARNKENMTALDIAKGIGHEDVIKALEA